MTPPSYPGTKLALRFPAQRATTPTNPLGLLTNMDTVFQASPYVEGHAQNSDTQTMDLVFQGSPFVRYRKSS
jgi:hypothetical protein